MNNEFIGNKFFGDLDFIIYCIFYWMVFVCMVFDRVIGMELVNEDNLKGYYMVDGVIYIYICGDEYYNIFFFWDWWWIFGIIIYESDVFILIESGVDLCN